MLGDGTETARVARILVIDDDANVRAFLDDVLSAVGHTVVVSSDGREGLSSYERLRPDLVITDIFMPQQDGLDVVLQLAAKVKSSPSPGAVTSTSSIIWRTLSTSERGQAWPSRSPSTRF